jgi:hypothetical protein
VLAEAEGFFRLLSLAQEIEDLLLDLRGQGVPAIDHLGEVLGDRRQLGGRWFRDQA